MISILGLYDISVAVGQAFRTLNGSIASLIYKMIISIYDIFILLSKAEILDSDFVQSIYRKVGLLLGMFMTFKLIFSLIQNLIDPEKMKDKKNGAFMIVKRAIITIVLLGLTPTIFSEAFKLQRLIVGTDNSNNVLYKLIVGDTVGIGNDFGRELSTTLFFSFYRDNGYGNGRVEYNPDSLDPDGIYKTISYDTLKEDIIKGDKDFNDAVKVLSVTSTGGDYVIEFDGIFINLVGIIVLWTLFMYCFQVAIRVFQLAYLQLIAPIPILSYISDPEKIFQKWLKQCASTYLDLFLRLILIYFVVALSSNIMIQLSNTDSILIESLGLTTSDPRLIWIRIFLILGLLLFAKKVPELLKDIFPSLGGTGKFSFGLSAKKTFNDTMAAGLLGAVGGAAGATASNAIHGYMNMKKAYKDNKGKGFTKTLGAMGKEAFKAPFSMIGGTIGGAKAGLGTKDITKINSAVKVANANREKRELMTKAGYRWYNSLPKGIEDNVLSFAGETSGAEAKIKTAQFRQEALQQSKSLAWESFYKANPRADLGLLRSIQEFEEKGKKVYKGIDKYGKELTFTKNAAGDYINTDATGRNILGAEAAAVSGSLDKDKQIKDQGKIIKGLQTADEKSKK